MVNSVEYSGHCYEDVMLVPRTEDSCKFAPCPSIGNITKFCKCCEFHSYNEKCPETCSSCPPSTVQGKILMLLYFGRITIISSNLPKNVSCSLYSFYFILEEYDLTLKPMGGSDQQ